MAFARHEGKLEKSGMIFFKFNPTFHPDQLWPKALIHNDRRMVEMSFIFIVPFYNFMFFNELIDLNFIGTALKYGLIQ